MLNEIDIDLEWRGRRYNDVERGLRAFADDLNRDFSKIIPIARRELKDYMKAVVLSVKERTTTPWPGGTSGAGTFPGTLSRRSGALSASLSPSRISVNSSGEEVSVTFPLTGIAVVHETGATIRPKNSQYLTIPLRAALDSRGVPLKAKARDWSDTFVARSKRGNLLIFQKQPGGGIKPLYVLKQSVTIPKRLAFKEAFLAGRDMLADRIAQATIREFMR